MADHIFGKLTFFDMLKIGALSFLQATSITILVNFIDLDSIIIPITGLLAFIIFQLLLLLPVDKDPHSIDFQYLLHKTWPIIIEIVLEIIILTTSAIILIPLFKSGYSTSDIYWIHYLCLVTHIIFLVPLYTYIFFKKKEKNYHYIEKSNIILDLKKNKHYSIAIMINLSYLLIFVIDANFLGIGSLVFYIGFLFIPFIFNLFFHKRVDPISKIIPSTIIKQFIFYITWFWIAIIGFGFLIVESNPTFQVFGFVNLNGLLLLQYFFQQNISKTLKITIPKRLNGAKSNSINSTEGIKCLTCGNVVESQLLTELSEDTPIYCVQCGEKIRFQEIYPLPKEKILSDHQKILKKVQQSPTTLHSMEEKH
ncbi:hypothetical protein NEF87_001767 [Candidatus Lokiarchaeum ossiferum]|uniref:Uncharacterized protein n=1 Tax=Candidatus Lokiarchaeum ossiferum TaxID=2951803 RepID=A0ABY6HPQ4_9ARCH|nr:hypothetical protein NEF87_001767 [Candidatus Lokiarchaeum sp. B-35]